MTYAKYAFHFQINYSRLLALAKTGLESENTSLDERVSIDVTNVSKELRKRFHEVVKTSFPHLVSNTKLEEDGRKMLEVFIASAAKSLKDKKAIGAARRPEGREKCLQ